jgi:hypothetical protein
MSNNWAAFKFKPNEAPPKVTEGTDPFNDQAEAASYLQPGSVEEPPKKKAIRDLKRGDKVKLATGEIFEMTSVEAMGGRFFAFNVEDENDRRMLKTSEVELL